VEEVFAGMVVSSDEREQHRPQGASTAPWGGKKASL